MKRGTGLLLGHAMLGVLTGMTVLFVAGCNPDQGKLPSKPSQGFGAAPGKSQDADPTLPRSRAEESAVDLPPADSAGTSDRALADKVKSSITAESAPGTVSLDVTAKNGIVTLHGTAATESERERATRVASSVAGVLSVKNELVIVRGS